MSEKCKTTEIVEIKFQEHTACILKQAVEFLEIFLPKTLAKRFVAIILLAIGVPVKTPPAWQDYPRKAYGHSINNCRNRTFLK